MLYYQEFLLNLQQINKKSLGTQLSDEKDGKNFLLEYLNSTSRNKEMMVIAIIKSNENENNKFIQESTWYNINYL